MATIAIQGIRIKTLTIQPKPDGLDDKISATYELISTAGKVMATQSLGGYSSEMKLSISPATEKALDTFLASYTNDVNQLIGLDGE